MPHYYKDRLNGTFPMYSAVPLNDPRFIEIDAAEWDDLRQRGTTEAHPYSPHVLNREAMEAAARDHIPPVGTQIPDPPPTEHPLAQGAIQGVIHEEG